MKTDKEKEETEVERARMYQSGEEEKTSLRTQAKDFAALSESMTGVIRQQGYIPKATKKHDGRITRAWLDLRGGIDAYVLVAFRRNFHQE